MTQLRHLSTARPTHIVRVMPHAATGRCVVHDKHDTHRVLQNVPAAVMDTITRRKLHHVFMRASYNTQKHIWQLSSTELVQEW